MSTTIGELCAHLESIAPLHLQETYDNAGLITGERDWEITGVICSLDATVDVVREAAEKGCNAVVAHHPIVFKGLKQISSSHYVGRAIIEAIRRDVAIYAIHTNLDNVLDQGVNQAIARKLELQDLSILAPKDPEGMTGAGMIGQLSHEMTENEFLQWVKGRMETACIRHTRLTGLPIKKVAICGGSGSFLTETAIHAGADAYITGDVKYHEFFDADGKLLLLDIGHFESEQFTIPLLAEIIREKFSNFAVHCTERTTNPVQYF